MRTPPLLPSLTLWTLLLAAPALAQEHRGHDHGHGAQAGPATERLALDHGKKWNTDAALRTGMAGIRDGIEAAVGPIHAGQYDAAKYEALAARVEGQVSAMIAACKLPEEVDAQVHLVLADLYAGTAAMKAKEGQRSAGVVKIIRALEAYAKHFEHPGWKPIAHD